MSILPSQIRIRIPNTDPSPRTWLNPDPIRFRIRNPGTNLSFFRGHKMVVFLPQVFRRFVKSGWLKPSVLWIRIHLDPHHFGKLDPDPHLSQNSEGFEPQNNPGVGRGRSQWRRKLEPLRFCRSLWWGADSKILIQNSVQFLVASMHEEASKL